MLFRRLLVQQRACAAAAAPARRRSTAHVALGRLPGSAVQQPSVQQQHSHWIVRPAAARAMLDTRALHTSVADQQAAEPPEQITEPMSFIEKAKVAGANALMGAFTSRGGFDSAFKDLTITRIGDGIVEAQMVVPKSLTNSYGTLHGGASATLVDILGTMALVSLDKNKPGVSVDINVSYLAAAKVGETITATGRVLKMGASLGFTDVVIRNESGKVVVSGRHTKAFPAKR